jgi:hypothetical protein
VSVQAACGAYFSHHDRKRFNYDNRYRIAFPSVELEPVLDTKDDETSEKQFNREMDTVLSRMITLRSPAEVRGRVEASLRLHDSMSALGSTWESQKQVETLEACQARARAGDGETREYLTKIIAEIINNQDKKSVDDTAAFIVAAVGILADLNTNTFDTCASAWQESLSISENALPVDVGDMAEVRTAIEIEEGIRFERKRVPVAHDVTNDERLHKKKKSDNREKSAGVVDYADTIGIDFDFASCMESEWSNEISSRKTNSVTEWNLQV